MEALLNLPDEWHVVVNDVNKNLLQNWLFSEREFKPELFCKYIAKDISYEKFQGDKLSKGSIEISTADFKRLVLRDKNYEDYCIKGSDKLEIYFRENKVNGLSGDNSTVNYFLVGKKWDFSGNCCNLQTLPLTEYLKLLPTEKKETIEKEVQITKTWETIFFTNGKSTVELTLNHDKKTFNLQTQSEEAVSFKKDTIESAKEKLKCIESALEYTEKYLNK